MTHKDSGAGGSWLRLLNLVPLVCFALGALAYPVFFTKAFIAPSRPVYGDPVTAYLLAGGLGLAGLVPIPLLWIHAAERKWILVLGGLLNALLVASVYFVSRVFRLGVMLF
jgi:hypothetical protein